MFVEQSAYMCSVLTDLFTTCKTPISGVYTWADGSKYEGEWRSGVKHGIHAQKPFWCYLSVLFIMEPLPQKFVDTREGCARLVKCKGLCSLSNVTAEIDLWQAKAHM